MVSRKIKLFIIRLFRLGIKILDLIIPEDKTLVLFGFEKGKYRGNTRYLFEYYRENELNGIGFSNDFSISDLIMEEYGGESAVELYSFKALWTFLRAKAVVLSHGHSDVYYLISNLSRKKVINLWHGIPIKTLGKIHDPHLKMGLIYDLVAVSSRVESYIMKSVFGENVREIVITGSPRNDELLLNFRAINMAKEHGLQDPMTWLSEKLKLDYIPKHVILYAPTFRSSDETIFFPYENFDFDQLQELCENNNALLILRGHTNDVVINNHNLRGLENIEEENSSFGRDGSLLPFSSSWIKILNQDKLADITEILHTVTLLITDYSGMYFDYLLMDKPIFFLPYDLERYRKETRFMYPYEVMTPGHKIYSGEDFIYHLDLYFKGVDNFSLKRKWIKELMHEQTEPIARELLAKKIKELTK